MWRVFNQAEPTTRKLPFRKLRCLGSSPRRLVEWWQTRHIRPITGTVVGMFPRTSTVGRVDCHRDAPILLTERTIVLLGSLAGTEQTILVVITVVAANNVVGVARNADKKLHRFTSFRIRFQTRCLSRKQTGLHSISHMNLRSLYLITPPGSMGEWVPRPPCQPPQDSLHGRRRSVGCLHSQAPLHRRGTTGRSPSLQQSSSH